MKLHLCDGNQGIRSHWAHKSSIQLPKLEVGKTHTPYTGPLGLTFRKEQPGRNRAVYAELAIGWSLLCSRPWNGKSMSETVFCGLSPQKSMRVFVRAQGLSLFPLVKSCMSAASE